MRLLLLLISFAISGAVAGATETAEQIVQRQVEAYNARNLDAFVSTYAEDAELVDFPDKPLMRAASQLRER